MSTSAEALPPKRPPHLLFYEGGGPPTTRSVRELSSLRNHGWDITVAHMPDAASAVEALGFRSCLLPPPRGNPLFERLTAEAAELTEQLQGIRDAINDKIDRQRGDEEAMLRSRLIVLRERVEKAVVRIGELRAARDTAGEAAARAELAAAKEERTAVAELIRTMDVETNAELTMLKEQRDATAARLRALRAARRLKTPLTGGAKFGDLARLEPRWHAHAPVLAGVPADIYWAADLDALPPVVWASEAGTNKPPVVFDSHELFCELEYMPELYRAAWRELADRFIPLVTRVITVCEPIAKVLDEEYGANGTIVIPNYAATGPATTGGLRGALGIDGATPLAIHVGNVSNARNPGLTVDLIAEMPQLHVAFVGAASTEIVDEVRAQADARGLGDRLHFVPPVPLAELTGFISDADVSLILLDGSRSRDTLYTMPNKLYDSLSAGVPVVAPEGSTAGEFLVAQQLGRDFKLNAPGQLAAAVGTVLTDPAIRDRARSRAAEFTWARAEPTSVRAGRRPDHRH